MATVREAPLEEHPELRALVDESYAEYAPYVTEEFVEGFRHELVELMDDPATEVLVAEVDGSAAGVVIYYPDGAAYGEGVPAEWSALRTLAVHPDFRRRGVGSDLMRECLSRAAAAGRTHVLLHTLPFMTGAIALHESMGFQRMAELDIAYTPEVTVMAYLRRL